MQFKDGTSVYSFDGQNVGHVDRVVLNPKTKEITHIVVQKGFLFTEDKIVPLHLIKSATEDRIALSEDAGDLDKLPQFEETHYIPVDDGAERTTADPIGTASALFWYPPMMGWMGYPGGVGYTSPPPYRTETDQNIPEDSVALKEGARVFSDNDEHVGDVTRVFTELPNNRMTHFLMSEGIIFKEKKLIPVGWIREIKAGEIYLGVGTSMLHKLHEYQEA